MIKDLILKLLEIKNKLLFKVTKKLSVKDQEVVLFGSSYGRYYSDNSKYVYEYILKNKIGQITPVWVTRSRKVWRELRKRGYPCAKAGSIRYFRYLHASRTGFFTNHLKDLFLFNLIPPGFRLIALRHGKSLKRVRHSVVGYEINETEKKERELESQLVKFSISTSDFISEIQEKDLLYGKEKHVVTGYPRNDSLLEPIDSETADWWEEFIKGIEPQKVILYCPSWRHGREPTRFFPFDDFKKEELIHLLEEHQILLLLRPHKNDLIRYSYFSELYDTLGESPWIRKLTHEELPDINSVLPVMDALITDYSSIYHDYLLLDRPILFIPYDFEVFNSSNGFHVDYLDWIPGPNISTFTDFQKELRSIAEGKDPMREKRREYTRKIHQYIDSNSTRRVTELLGRLLSESS